jgi:hypothetical protein
MAPLYWIYSCTAAPVLWLYDKVDMKWANWKVRLGQKQDVV